MDASISARSHEAQPGQLDMSVEARLADALDDVKRLHDEKMKFFERTIELERELETWKRDNGALHRACEGYRKIIDAAPSSKAPTQNEFLTLLDELELTLLDELEGIQGSYETAGGEEARKLNEERWACRKKLLSLFAAAQEATYPSLSAPSAIESKDAARWRYGVEHGWPRRERQIHPEVKVLGWRTPSQCPPDGTTFFPENYPYYETAEAAIDAAMAATDGTAHGS